MALPLLLLAAGCGADAGSDPLSGDADSNEADGSTSSQDDGMDDGSESASLTGTLGDLGPVQPIVSAKVISNSGETLVYLTTAPLTCDELTVSRWLGNFSAGAQVVEIVISGKPQVGVADDDAEVNFAKGGRSSAYETAAQAGSVTFTKSVAMGPVEGHVMATYKNPAGSVKGTFHAQFCPGGQGY